MFHSQLLWFLSSWPFPTYSSLKDRNRNGVGVRVKIRVFQHGHRTSSQELHPHLTTVLVNKAINIWEQKFGAASVWRMCFSFQISPSSWRVHQEWNISGFSQPLNRFPQMDYLISLWSALTCFALLCHLLSLLRTILSKDITVKNYSGSCYELYHLDGCYGLRS